LFWTDPLRDDGVRADLKEGKARMTASNLHVRDFFNIPNALFHLQHPVSVGATVSFDFRWLGPATDPSAVTSPPGSSGRRQGIQIPIRSIRHDKHLWPARAREERDLLPLKQG